MNDTVLVVATQNRGKLAELRALLKDLPVRVMSVEDVLKTKINVVEDGATFEANAIKKAKTVAEATMMLTLADDSGLEVDALGGRPGVRSARFAHERATDAENNAALLQALDELSDADPQSGIALGPAMMTARHTARFRCVLALVDPFTNDGEPYLAEGVCEGEILRTPRGSGGFGYDPIFLVKGTEKTMAELDESEKNKLSHRARAWEKMKLVIEKVLAARREETERISLS
jgi:XTP/dITP diphosphohydrolase